MIPASTHPLPPSLRRTPPQLPHRNQLPNHQILLRKLLLPPLQRLQLLPIQIRQRIQRPIQILRQHILIKTPTRQPATRIPPREVRIRSAGTVKVPAGGDVEDAAAHGEVYWFAVQAVFGQQCPWREGLEDGCWRSLWEEEFGAGPQLVVGYEEEEGEED
jgi:hypothetical protein